MNLEQASAFATFAVAAAITPGPSNVMLAATGAVAGIVRGLRCLAGVTLGMGLLMLVVGLGLGALITQHPLVLATMRWAGATLLLWLSWKIATAPYAAATGTDAAEPVGFVGGFSFQWLNPKSWLVTTSAAGTFFEASTPMVQQAVAIACLFVFIVFACGLVWLGFGAALRRLLDSPKIQRSFNVAMGLLLALSVVLFIF